ncbi:MAG TPA: XdhC family protein [Asticcacaulis sp.]|nr:XdhC family protein [Asticcacaulis sp.]
MVLPPVVYRDFVLDRLLDWRAAGRGTALLTLVDATGASPRPVGSQMAVNDAGESLGLITGGCAEGALIHDTLDAMAKGQSRTEIYGEGSRYMDIRLPCGSGLKVRIEIEPDEAALRAVLAARQARRLSKLEIDTGEGVYVRHYRPECRLVVAGRGPIVGALTQLAPVVEMAAVVYSPDSVMPSDSDALTALPLRSPQDFDGADLDAFTALILLFHDHSFEPDILAKGLCSEAFYIGALGSRKAHAQRLETLSAMGFSPSDLARIDGPAGLPIGARTPPEIALSILARAVAGWREDMAGV